MRNHACFVLCVVVGLFGCGGGAATPDDAGAAVDSSGTLPDTGPVMMTTIPGGDQSGTWCGLVTVTGDVNVPVGQTLHVCAGSTVSFASGTGLSVDGTLAVDGTTTGHVTMTSDATWTGLSIQGTLTATFLDMTSVGDGITGSSTSTITVSDATVAESGAMSFAHGATIDRATITGGQTFEVSGGVLSMTDTTLDLGHPELSPDCINVDSGGLTLDHAHVTGCHCPVHINQASDPVSITSSILDGAADPVMIANATATIHMNNLVGVSALVLDIGTGHGITCDVAGNYWDHNGAHTVNVVTSAAAQFTGTDMTSAATGPIAGAGPR